MNRTRYQAFQTLFEPANGWATEEECRSDFEAFERSRKEEKRATMHRFDLTDEERETLDYALTVARQQVNVMFQRHVGLSADDKHSAESARYLEKQYAAVKALQRKLFP